MQRAVAPDAGGGDPGSGAPGATRGGTPTPPAVRTAGTTAVITTADAAAAVAAAAAGRAAEAGAAAAEVAVAAAVPDDLHAVGVGRRAADPASTVRANRHWWDTDADAYHAEHGDFLGVDDF